MIQKLQQRLLNFEKYQDYLLATIFGLIPIVFAKLIGIWEPIDIGNNQYIGFSKSTNFISLVFLVPAALFLLRICSKKLFGIQETSLEKVPLLTMFSEQHFKRQVRENLEKTVVNPKLPIIIFGINIVFHYFDMRKIFNDYLQSFIGNQVTFHIYPSREWVSLCFIREDKISISKNFIFLIVAHIPQFIIVFIAFMLISEVLLHNIFYLKLIYQRSKVLPKDINYHIVLDFDDTSERFGLKDISFIFNLQLVTLVVTGLFCLFSRFAYVPEDKRLDVLNMQFPKLSDLFPEFGQYIILIAWLIAFIIVLIPSFVKFLPIFSKDVWNDSWTRDSYLKEFIPPNYDQDKYPMNTLEEVSKVATKFARSSFWPIGDDIARYILYYVFTVFFLLIFPIKLYRGLITFLTIIIFIILGITCGNLFLYAYKWGLSHINGTLTNPNQDQGDRQMTVYGDSFSNISNSQIVNKSVVQGSFKVLQERFGPDAVDAITRVEEEINKSGNKEAAELFESFNKEIQKIGQTGPGPSKPILRSFWNSIVSLVPTLNGIAEITSKILQIIS
ncbi:MAG: hypothetical protein V7L25_23465 [Nostoc sp.]|uniref:hypothetical protein n=1 Tax=Nostoc sp. TaxID=1180 RepID=UPI002FEFA943